MSDFEEAERVRARKTKLLIAGGVVSLVLPLLGVAYIKITDTSANSLPISVQGAVFDRRETTSQAITPVTAAQPMAAAPAPPVPGQKPGGSLGFISGGNEYYQDDKPAPKVGAAMQQAANQAGGEAAGALTVTGKDGAKPAAAPTAAAAKTAAKTAAAQPAAKKPWSPPRLNSSGGGIGAARFGPQVGSSAGGIGQSGVAGGGGMGGGAPGGAPPGMPPGMDMNALMGAAGAGGAGGAPDMGALMKNLPGGGAGMPQMPQMPPQGGGNQ